VSRREAIWGVEALLMKNVSGIEGIKVEVIEI